MRVNGEWYPCADGIVRPVLWGEVLASSGAWMRAGFLIDTGADRTVLSGNLLNMLRLPIAGTAHQLGSLGGLIDPVLVQTQIRLTREDGGKLLLRGTYYGVTELSGLERTLLGRDVLNLFAVIVDQPGNVVCLVSQRHGYSIVAY